MGELHGGAAEVSARVLPDVCPLPARSDPAFERFVRLVHAQLDVPVALVSLISWSEQVFPGAVGLPEPYQQRRRTPLAMSVCQHVVAQGRRVVLSDVRAEQALADNLAWPVLGVVAYAGVPVRDADGLVVGSLCAIDTRPRAWTDVDLAVLDDLAAACTSELSLRQLRERAEAARTAALRTEAAEQRARMVAEVLLRLSEALTLTTTAADVLTTVSDLTRARFAAERAGLALVGDGRRPTYLSETQLPAALGRRWATAVLRATERSPRFLAGRAALEEALPLLAGLEAEGLDDGAAPQPPHGQPAPQPPHGRPAPQPQPAQPALEAVALVPLVAAGTRLGVLVLGWSHPLDLDEDDQQLLRALAGYSAQAVARAQLLQSRRDVAHVLQRSLLTDLPHVDGVEVAARYTPASDGEQVGGDWYDAVALPGGAMVVAVGDVTGHDMRAAAQMGQLRSTLRTLAWSRPDPAAALQQTDAAILALTPGTSATAVLARLDPPGDDGSRVLTWSNAGHPPGLLLLPDGTVEQLPGTGDLLLGVLPDIRRHEAQRVIPSGSTLVLFTDGLVERRREDIDLGHHRAARRLAELGGLAPEELVARLVDDLVGPTPDDDVAVLAVRTCTPGTAGSPGSPGGPQPVTPPTRVPMP